MMPESFKMADSAGAKSDLCKEGGDKAEDSSSSTASMSSEKEEGTGEAKKDPVEAKNDEKSAEGGTASSNSEVQDNKGESSGDAKEVAADTKSQDDPEDKKVSSKATEDKPKTSPTTDSEKTDAKKSDPVIAKEGSGSDETCKETEKPDTTKSEKVKTETDSAPKTTTDSKKEKEQKNSGTEKSDKKHSPEKLKSVKDEKTRSSDTPKSEKSSSSKSDGQKSDKSSASKSDGQKSDKSSSSKSDGQKSDKSSSKSDGQKSDKSSSSKSDGQKSDKSSSSKSDGHKSDKSSSSKSDVQKSDKPSSSKSDRQKSDKSSSSKSDSQKSEKSSSGKSDGHSKSDKSSSSKSDGHKSEKSSSKSDGQKSEKSSPSKSEGEKSSTDKHRKEKEGEKSSAEKREKTKDTKASEVKKEKTSPDKSGPAGSSSGTQPAVKEDVEESMEVDVEEGKAKEDEEAMTCYCGKERDLKSMELQCGFCLRFYHEDCITQYLGKCVPYMTNYQFFCKRCNPNGLESFTKKQPSFSQMCHTAIANLTAHNPEKRHFSKEKEIIPFIDKNWERLTTAARRIKNTWHTTIARTLIKEPEMFAFNEEAPNSDPQYGLAEQDLTKIGPNYENLFKSAGPSFLKSEYRLGGFADGKTRGTKRKAPDSQTVPGLKQKRGEVSSLTSAPHLYPVEHPFNKDGYRYILAEPDPHAPNRDAFDQSVEMAGKPIPGYLYRTWLGNQVLLASHDRAPQLKLSEDRLTVTGEKGYSMIRATHGVSRGQWYYEVKIMDMPTDTATRIGWSQALGNLQAPCGYDRFSYSWRSRKGTRFHHSRGKHFSNEYKEGDTLGFFISLPDPEDPLNLLPVSIKDKPLVKFKSHLYFEEKDYVVETEKKLKPIEGSQILLYKNGHPQGVAWTDINEGTYYPAASIYKNATVRFNFGPRFRHVPKGLKNFRPMSDMANEAMVEYAVADLLYHVEHEGRQPEF